MSIIKSKTPILGINHEIYISSVLEKEKYYFLSEFFNNIDIYDKTLHFISKVEIEKNCDNITFRKDKKLFYFHSAAEKIIITDEEFKVIKKANCNLNKACVKGMCYSEVENMLYLITNEYIVLIDDTYKIKKTLTKSKISRNKKIINESMYMEQFPISNFTAISIINGELYIAYTRENESYIAKLENGEIIDEYFIDIDCYIRSIINYKGTIKLFASKKQNYIYETNICVEKQKLTQKHNIKEEKKEKTKEKCNHIKKEEYNNNCKAQCSENCICSVMESIAKEEVRNFQYIIFGRRKTIYNVKWKFFSKRNN